MKKAIFFLITFLLISNLHASAQYTIPQLQAGVYIDSTFAFYPYQFLGYCDTIGLYEVRVSVNSDLSPPATGVEIQAIVTQLTTLPDSAYTLEAGTLHLGDTLRFSSPANNHFTFYTHGGGGMGLEFKIVGTPTVPFQTYPCLLSLNCTISNFCGYDCIYTGFTPAPCSVDDFNKINDISGLSEFTVQPTLFENEVTINSGPEKSTIQITDIPGKVFFKQNIPGGKCTINLSGLSKGLYFLKEINSGKKRVVKLVKR